MTIRASILLLCLAATPVAAQTAGATGDAATGERLFKARCATCHSVVPGQNRIGPSLANVMGRRAGTLEGARYSQGMRDLGIVWDQPQMETYLANPRAMVKDTTMILAVPSAADRAALGAYLQSISKTD